MRRIEIMRSEPTVQFEGRILNIKGRSRELLRLLVLHEGRTVPKESIALLRDTQPDTVNSKIRYLKGQLASIGCESIVESDPGLGYRLNLDGWSVDTKDFLDAAQPLKHSIHDQWKQGIDEVTAQGEVLTLNKAWALWHTNPAHGLPAEDGLEARYAGLKERLEDRLLLARLYSHRHTEIREAIQELEHRIRSGRADHVLWELLLLAYDASGNHAQISKVWEHVSEYYKRNVPVHLQNFVAELHSGKCLNPFSIPGIEDGTGLKQAVTNGAHEGGQTLQDICATLGITTASHLRLQDSHLTPMRCILRTRSRLHFAGVLASKWVAEAAVRNAFTKLLTRLDQEDGEVKFLIINPNGTGYQRLVDLRDGAISSESVAHLRILVKEHQSFKVRLYDSLPAFRIVVIDNDVVGFSPYRLAADAYQATGLGWEAPHVVLDPLAPYPLAEAFQLLFMETWLNAVPLEEFQ